MSAPRFSVIIPAYNAKDTLARAVDSVLAQIWPAFEIIVIDDGSIDATATVAASYGEKIRYLHQDNAGVSAARNHGARIASGDWLAFLDADDWYFPNRLKRHGEWIVRDENLDFLTGDYEYRDASGALMGLSMESKVSGCVMLAKAADSREVVMQEEEFEVFIADHFGDTHTLSLPRATFLELGGYPLGFKVCEDVHLLTRLVARSRRVGVICEPLAVYSVHAASATRADPVRAQFENVRTLIALGEQAANLPAVVRRGYTTRLRQARLNLGYALSRTGNRVGAVRAVLPSLIEAPSLASVRNLLSILKG
ncbi:Glycosyl transferase family 2 [Candidatus Nitrotoga sp. BS]|uniref:glycosyltransferase family 2 protein n=1 Tax=Candidatus Nitrotoga sp. BS TaxID=2890408 RepID=UPI001EF21637|nr:glycosyltransferase family 2 protein [Candidatus Nitrotoga sp. BS]CAH1202345.1 Glycosyl transferase family 2 [Candidatus Nitrotoga sp. BS]